MVTSAKTSVNRSKAPAVLGMLPARVMHGMTVVDYGCGRWPGVTAERLYQMGAAEVVSYDPYNYPEGRSDLDEILSSPDTCRADRVLLSNVLNVIPDRETRAAVLRECMALTSPLTGEIYVTVYEGDRSGHGRMTGPDCWQENRRTADYVREIQEALPGYTVERHGKLIVVH